MNRSAFVSIAVAFFDWYRHRSQSDYEFSWNDFRLFCFERRWHEPRCSVIEDGAKRKLCVNNQAFFWPDNFGYSGLGWIYNEVFEPWERNPASYAHPELWRRNVRWVIDGGGCEGFFANFCMARQVEKILVVEPIAPMVECLLRTFQEEIALGRIEVLPVALGSCVGHGEMMIHQASLWDSHMTTKLNEPGERQTVIKSTIDTLVNSQGLSNGGLIKLDVEGAEMEALAGATETMRLHKPSLAIAVYHSEHNANLCKQIILDANSSYQVEFRGFYAWARPTRPYLLFAW